MFSGFMITQSLLLAGPHVRSLSHCLRFASRSRVDSRAPVFLAVSGSGSPTLGPRFAVVSLCLASLLIVACEKVPLLAPSGSTIILTASTTALPANGTADLVAQILEAAGTPPHSGTHVIFTTTLGVIEPAEAVT